MLVVWECTGGMYVPKTFLFYQGPQLRPMLLNSYSLMTSLIRMYLNWKERNNVSNKQLPGSCGLRTGNYDARKIRVGSSSDQVVTIDPQIHIQKNREY